MTTENTIKQKIPWQVLLLVGVGVACIVLPLAELVINGTARLDLWFFTFFLWIGACAIFAEREINLPAEAAEEQKRISAGAWAYLCAVWGALWAILYLTGWGNDVLTGPYWAFGIPALLLAGMIAVRLWRE
jgi:hypothetical protein